jgi:hypothetical protein
LPFGTNRLSVQHFLHPIFRLEEAVAQNVLLRMSTAHDSAFDVDGIEVEYPGLVLARIERTMPGRLA